MTNRKDNMMVVTEIEMSAIAEQMQHDMARPTDLDLQWLRDFETHFAGQYRIEREKEALLNEEL